MTIKEDVELLRSFARYHWSSGAGVIGGMVADFVNSRGSWKEGSAVNVLHAVVRLYSSDGGLPPNARFDLANLRGYLAVVPMTVEQREAVAGRLNKLDEAVTHEAPPLVEYRTCECGRTFTGDYCLLCRERHAEIAIESITEEIGIHDYRDAAKAVLATWRAAVQMRKDRGLPTEPSTVAASAMNIAVAAGEARDAIKTLHGIFHTTSAEWLVAVAQGAFSSSNDGAWLLGVKRKWDAWSTNDPKAEAQQRVIDILRALRESMDEPLTDALDETIDVLEHMLGTTPF
jgi:hypothetical protein